MDDEERPSWAKDDAVWKRWQGVAEKARRAGYTGIGAGWARRHGHAFMTGSVTLTGKLGSTTTLEVWDTTPPAAIEATDWYLDRILEAEDYR